MLHAVPVEPDEQLAEMFERLAKEVREGKLIGGVVLLNYTDTTGSVHGGFWRKSDALYAFETWKHRMLHAAQDEI